MVEADGITHTPKTSTGVLMLGVMFGGIGGFGPSNTASSLSLGMVLSQAERYGWKAAIWRAIVARLTG